MCSELNELTLAQVLIVTTLSDDDEPEKPIGTAAKSPLGAADRPMTQYGYSKELLSGQTVDDFRDSIDRAVKRLGLGAYICYWLTTSGHKANLHTLDEAWMQHYISRGLHDDDLALENDGSDNRPFFRSSMNEYATNAAFPCAHTRNVLEIQELNDAFGYHDFYNLPYRSQDSDGLILLCVTRQGMAPSALKRTATAVHSDLRLLCASVGIASTIKFRKQIFSEHSGGAAVAINPRPLEVLDMLANNDLNITQVAAKLGINTVTANRHLQAARKAFGVSTNNAAIRLAILSGRIKYKSS